ncbi:hypothetical protein PC129_g17029 [Phytophthora cactorum]|uniref:Uncharacterized protein n=1 Tax=Phytophthora cactorum TaxID=29920 RepID=A0A329RD74_9STRA|nr:hypothetical protein Pcac1_g39 [Phytophthora cactorum]KAG2889438.1 hypothetical protein PC114_g17942 [Phytophthora cactorum]KAG2917819.1 hypothetical protein PC117_g17281 [Phytophthora cactorum]KAG2970586.1 hypothetical protein PC119_g23615 [Phytophthora cactorum]KAG3004490.1 hypothetical protein PC120_g18519 [Phytophthora cactorum]
MLAHNTLNHVGVPSSGCLLANDAAAAAVEADDEFVVLVSAGFVEELGDLLVGELWGGL